MQCHAPPFSGSAHLASFQPSEECPVEAMGCPFYWESAMEDSSKDFAEVQVDISTAFPSSTRWVTQSLKEIRLIRQKLSFLNLYCLALIPCDPVCVMC